MTNSAADLRAEHLLESDDLSDGDESHAQVLFDRYRACLLRGKSWVLDHQPDQLALSALDQLARLLRTGSASAETLNMVAEFVQRVSDASTRSESAWKRSATLAFEILGHSPQGRREKCYQRIRAIDAFALAIEEGAQVAEAERRAYDAYFFGQTRAYAKDSMRAENHTRGADLVSSNRAEKALESTIRPFLRKAKVLPKKRLGRPLKRKTPDRN